MLRFGSGAASHPAGELVQRDAIRREECRDLVDIDRIRQDTHGLVSNVRETRSAQCVCEMLPREYSVSATALSVSSGMWAMPLTIT